MKTRGKVSARRGFTYGRICALLAAFLGLCAPGSVSAAPQGPPAAQSSSQSVTGAGSAALPASGIAPNPQKAKASYQEGIRAEKDSDWQTAYSAYSDAVSYAPQVRDYQLRREVVKARLVQSRVDTAEKDAISKRLDDARRELLDALYLDPTNTTLRERFNELLDDEPQKPEATTADLADVPQLAFQPGTRSFDVRGNTEDAYREVAQQFGVEVSFDVDLRSRQIHFRASDVDFTEAVSLLGHMTATFWRPIGPHLFFIADDTPQNRRQYEVSQVSTILLPASVSPDEMTETLRAIREITGITRTELDTNSRTITLRASPQAVAVATGLIENLEQPSGELVLEAEILQVDRSVAQQLGITPPQTSQAFSVSSQQIQEAQQSAAGLVDVITQLFGSTTVPGLIAFGGGDSTFLATLPGASANFGRVLSLVQQGRRVLLRAKDGQPATFFVGERYPVSLTTFSASLGASSTSSSNVNPITNYAAGNTPESITSASLRNNSIDDLIVANSADNTVSVLLGNGDGTFGTQTTFVTGTDPVWVTTGSFDSSANSNLDLAVANKGANTVSILLGNGDGTFQPKTDIATGNSPVCVLLAVFHDLTNNGIPDLAVADQADNTIGIYEGNGDGTFKAPVLLSLPAGFKPAGMATADVNADGHIDLLVADEGNNSVSVFLGNGDGTFQPRTDYPVGNSPVAVATGDFNADGFIDFVSANNGAPTTTNTGDNISLYLGQHNNQNVATGTFAVGTQRDFAAGTSPTSLAVADFNLDGLPDVIVSASGDNAVSVILNAGNGLFNTNVELPAATAPSSIVSEDFNADGRPDAAVSNSGSANATVILNTNSLFGSGNGLLGSLFPGVQYLDIGLKMKATPRIHTNGDVTLQLSLELSTLAGSSLNSIPVIANQSVEQTVRLRENETGVLAGFVQTQLSNAITGTPGVGEIPVGDYLAGDQNAQRDESEVLILLTPRLVRLATRENRRIYAGQGSLDNAGAAAAPTPFGGERLPGRALNPGAAASETPAGENPAAQPSPVPVVAPPAQPAPAGETPPPAAAQPAPNGEQPPAQPPVETAAPPNPTPPPDNVPQQQ